MPAARSTASVLLRSARAGRDRTPHRHPPGPAAHGARLVARRSWLNGPASAAPRCSRLERSELSPTAAMLGKLCTTYGWTLSRLMADAECPRAQSGASQRSRRSGPIPRAATGAVPCRRRRPELRGEVVEVRMPAGATVSLTTPRRSPVSSTTSGCSRARSRWTSTSTHVPAAGRRLSPLRPDRPDAVHAPRATRGARYVIAPGAAVSEAAGRTRSGVRIEEWRPDAGDPHAGDARRATCSADVLHAVVHAGAGVSFIVPFSLDDARAFWT